MVPSDKTHLLALFRVVFPFFSAIALCGCSTTRQGRSVETSGFFEDYSIFEESGSGEAQLVYVNPEVDFTAYDKVLVDSILIIVAEDSALEKLDKEETLSLAACFHDAIVQELSQDYVIVREAGPGVLRLRAAITEARGSKVVLDAATALIPQTRLLTSGIQLAADTSTAVGKARAEAELLDSVTGERLLAGVDERSGTKALRGSLKQWGDVKDAYQLWARRMRERLERERQADGGY